MKPRERVKRIDLSVPSVCVCEKERCGTAVLYCYSGGCVYHAATFRTLALIAVGLVNALSSVVAWCTCTLIGVYFAHLSCEA